MFDLILMAFYLTYNVRPTAIESNYAACDWRAKFYTLSAVSNKDGKSDFFTDNAMGQLEWGAGIVEGNNNVKAQKKPNGKTGM